MSVERYQCEDGRGVEFGPVFDRADEAKDFAIRHSLRVVAYVYEMVDSELVWDFTGEESEG